MNNLKFLVAPFIVVALLQQPSLSRAEICTADPTKSKGTITKCLDKASVDDVILLMPGEYRSTSLGGLETYPLQMKPGVSLIGYGANSTTLLATGSIAIVGSSGGVKIQGVTIETDQTALFLTEPSMTEGLEVRDCRIISGWSVGIGNGSNIKGNTTSVVVDNCEFIGRDWLFNVSDAASLTILNSSFTGDMTGEAALSGRVGKLVLSSISIKGFPDNFQFWADEVLMDDVDILNTFYIAPPSNILIRDSRIGHYGGGPVDIRAGSPGNAVKIVDTMLYGGLRANTTDVILNNCYDEALNPITVNP